MIYKLYKAERRIVNSHEKQIHKDVLFKTYLYY